MRLVSHKCINLLAALINSLFIEFKTYKLSYLSLAIHLFLYNFFPFIFIENYEEYPVAICLL